MVEHEGRRAAIWTIAIAAALVPISALVYRSVFGRPLAQYQRLKAFLLLYAALVLVVSLVCFVIGYISNGLGFPSGPLVVRIGGGLGALFFLGALLWLACGCPTT